MAFLRQKSAMTRMTVLALKESMSVKCYWKPWNACVSTQTQKCVFFNVMSPLAIRDSLQTEICSDKRIFLHPHSNLCSCQHWGEAGSRIRSQCPPSHSPLALGKVMVEQGAWVSTGWPVGEATSCLFGSWRTSKNCPLDELCVIACFSDRRVPVPQICQSYPSAKETISQNCKLLSTV